MFQSIFFTTTLLCVAVFGQQEPQGDVILRWNDEALNQVRTQRLGAFDAARAYALLNVAMFDVANGVDGRRARFNEALVVPPNRRSARRNRPNRMAAVSAAANEVLSQLFPESTDAFDFILNDIVDGLGGSTNTRVRRGLRLGESVGSEVIAVGSTDGSTPRETQLAGEGVPLFRSDFGSAAFRNVEPLFVEDALVYVSPNGPPALDSPEYAAAHTEVRLLGDVGYVNEEYDEIFSFWQARGGSVRPPGEWIKITQAVAEQQGTTESLIQTSLLFATMSMALNDASIAVVADKFQYQFWRPETAIREADMDGNDDTTQDLEWSPRNGSRGGSPEHTSGQSAFAGVGSTILAAFYGNDNIEFEAEGDNSIAGPRTFASFSDAAREAGRSRIFSGIHFEFSNQAGQATGRGIAREVLSWQYGMGGDEDGDDEEDESESTSSNE